MLSLGYTTLATGKYIAGRPPGCRFIDLVSDHTISYHTSQCQSGWVRSGALSSPMQQIAHTLGWGPAGNEWLPSGLGRNSRANPATSTCSTASCGSAAPEPAAEPAISFRWYPCSASLAPGEKGLRRDSPPIRRLFFVPLRIDRAQIIWYRSKFASPPGIYWVAAESLGRSFR
jgi:hypothetical protein